MSTSEALSVPPSALLPSQGLPPAQKFVDSQSAREQSRPFIPVDRLPIGFYPIAVAIGLWIAGAHSSGIQHFIAQICVVSWQISLIFGLQGVIISFLLAQFYLNRSGIQSRIRINRWNVISSVMVTVLTMSILALILMMPSIA